MGIGKNKAKWPEYPPLFWIQRTRKLNVDVTVIRHHRWDN